MPAYFNKKTKKWDLHFSIQGKQFTVRGFSDKEEALEEEKYQIDKRTNFDSKISKVSFRNVMKIYLDEWVSHFKPNGETNTHYRVNRHYIPIVADKPYYKVDYQDFYAWFNYINKTKLKGKGRYLSLMRAIVKFAKKRFLIDKEPILDQLPPFNEEVVVPKEHVFYSIDQFILFREQIPVYQNYVMANLMYLCGLRIGEVRALTWDTSVNLETKQILIFRSVTTKTLRHRLEETTPKTQKSIRKIPIGGNLLEMLKKLRAESVSDRTGDYVFPSPRYGRKAPISEMAVKRFLDDAAKAAGLPQIDKHELRHSFASSLADMGVDSETIGSLLGHSSKGITEKFYIHPNEKKRVDAMADLDCLLTGNFEKQRKA